jgi:hypothetical protein
MLMRVVSNYSEVINDMQTFNSEMANILRSPVYPAIGKCGFYFFSCELTWFTVSQGISRCQFLQFGYLKEHCLEQRRSPRQRFP